MASGRSEEYLAACRDELAAYERASWRRFRNIVPGFEPTSMGSADSATAQEKAWNRAAKANRLAGRPTKCPECSVQLPVSGVCDCAR